MLAALTALTIALAGGPTSQAVRTLDGSWHHPLAEAKGKALALVFIAHDCPICNAYAPEIVRIAKTFGRLGAKVELVYAEPGLTLSAARAHAKAYSYNGMSIFLDPTGALAKACGAKITPEAAVYDSSGRLTYRGRIDDLYVSFGKQRVAATSHDLRMALDATLKSKPPLHARTDAVGCYIASQST